MVRSKVAWFVDFRKTPRNTSRPWSQASSLMPRCSRRLTTELAVLHSPLFLPVLVPVLYGCLLLIRPCLTPTSLHIYPNYRSQASFASVLPSLCGGSFPSRRVSCLSLHCIFTSPPRQTNCIDCTGLNRVEGLSMCG